MVTIAIQSRTAVPIAATYGRARRCSLPIERQRQPWPVCLPNKCSFTQMIAAQLESAINYGLSAALYGEITFADGKPQQANFDTYQVIRMQESPLVEAHILSSKEAPSGVGEPGLPPVAPAVGNAIFALTQKRVRRLPMIRGGQFIA